jgi:hypothetical protein
LIALSRAGPLNTRTGRSGAGLFPKPDPGQRLTRSFGKADKPIQLG